MKIYTKTGDAGETGLIGGKRVRKHNLAVKCYGTLDELNSMLGICSLYMDMELHTQNEIQEPRGLLENIQNRLFDAGAVISTPAENHKDAPKQSQFSAHDCRILEESIDSMNSKIPELRAFILPSGPSRSGAYLHFARTVSRRAERILVEYSDEFFDVSSDQENLQNLLAYMNRLSDWLFTAARFCNIKTGGENSERKWKS